MSEALAAAIDAARRLGLDTGAATDAATTIEERTGYPGDLYVLALAGGTGVGKSSLLNALAGETVSAASIRRPTTAEPVAWVPAARAGEVAPLLAWLGGARVHEHARDDVPPVAVVDLPDLDSIEPAHAAQVDAVLPRVDAVAWITDPEKYHDAVLHDAYLRRWMRRLGHQAIVVNKVDRLTREDAERVRADLIARLMAEGLPRTVPVLLTSAPAGAGALTGWIAEGAHAKEVVAGRLAAAAGAAIEDLAALAGVDGPEPPPALVGPDRRAVAVVGATREILATLDVKGLREQAVAATRLAARPRGGGPIGVARGLVTRSTGQAGRTADPQAYLRRWRDRGSMTRAVGPVRDLVTDTLPALPPSARPGLVALAEPAQLAERFTAAADRAVTGPAGDFRPPTSRWWPVLGIGQLVATAAVALGILWLVTLWLSHGQTPTPTWDVPVLGAVPVPTLLIALGIVGWFVLGRLLTWHAGRLGARWAEQLSAAVTKEVDAVVRDAVERPLAERDAARRALWSAMRATQPG
ncbi:MAG: GTPase [Chloroflexota bacterium]